jgi:hypothetical protein
MGKLKQTLVVGGLSLLGTASSVFAQTAEPNGLPAEFAPTALVTSAIGNNKGLILVGGGAVVGLSIAIALFKGMGRKGASVAR